MDKQLTQNLERRLELIESQYKTQSQTDLVNTIKKEWSSRKYVGNKGNHHKFCHEVAGEEYNFSVPYPDILEYAQLRTEREQAILVAVRKGLASHAGALEASPGGTQASVARPSSP